jgi:hypothetical protein
VSLSFPFPFLSRLGACSRVKSLSHSLIRKSNLAHTIALFLSKNPDSPLRQAAPKTFHFTCSFADEIDELLMDDLYEVDQSFAEAEEKGAPPKWWILKAALADKGNGIRLFSDRETLEEIFREFEPESDDDEEDEEEDEDANATSGGTTRAAMFGADTRVDATQLREWVIQVGPPFCMTTAHLPSIGTHEPALIGVRFQSTPPGSQAFVKLGSDQVPSPRVCRRRRRHHRLRPPPFPGALCLLAVHLASRDRLRDGRV